MREITVGAEATKLLQIAGITVTSSRRLATKKERNISESKLDQNGSLNDVKKMIFTIKSEPKDLKLHRSRRHKFFQNCKTQLWPNWIMNHDKICDCLKQLKAILVRMESSTSSFGHQLPSFDANKASMIPSIGRKPHNLICIQLNFLRP